MKTSPEGKRTVTLRSRSLASFTGASGNVAQDVAQRFGAVRLFVAATMGFGICSALCGLAPSLGMLVLFRVLQGLCGGPIMPITQSLMRRIFPPAKQAMALGLWSMTTVVAPIAGPLLGGELVDTAGWPWIFYVNVPAAIVISIVAWRSLAKHDTPTERRPVDFTGLALLVTWVGGYLRVPGAFGSLSVQASAA